MKENILVCVFAASNQEGSSRKLVNFTWRYYRGLQNKTHHPQENACFTIETLQELYQFYLDQCWKSKPALFNSFYSLSFIFTRYSMKITFSFTFGKWDVKNAHAHMRVSRGLQLRFTSATGAPFAPQTTYVRYCIFYLEKGRIIQNHWNNMK